MDLHTFLRLKKSTDCTKSDYLSDIFIIQEQIKIMEKNSGSKNTNLLNCNSYSTTVLSLRKNLAYKRTTVLAN